ncbi:MAG: shikimate kinase [Candidatus Moranbacteria bacterium]|nr:shikimate kinase [Candidatus Moranbacteria bacterium]
MNLALIGFMGAGKTETAKILGEILDYQIKETDEEIIKASEFETIKEIFNHIKELGFRKLETRVIEQLSDQNQIIISTGGGAVMNQINMLNLNKNSIIIYLKTEFETLKKRVAQDYERPLFQDPNKAKKLFKLREPVYEYYAQYIIKTDDLVPKQVAEQIIKKIKAHVSDK